MKKKFWVYHIEILTQKSIWNFNDCEKWKKVRQQLQNVQKT